LVSQPLAAIPSQLPKPALHAMTAHAPALQVSVAFGRLHARPHAPQWARAVLVLVSQPLAAIPSQLAKPALQRAMPHAPLVHAPTPLAGAHARLHAPQCAAFERVSTQAAPHIMSPGPAHRVAHAPFEQTWPAAHARPHAPQCAVALRVSVSQPLAGLPSQSAKPASQRATTHAPAAHASAALGRLHARPHAPQWLALVWVSTQAPLQSA
jgi:hypothetical protein